MTGRTGPKISSPMTGSCGVALSMMVGSILRAFSSAAPPSTTRAGSMSPRTRSKCLRLTILP